jgi:hypothetical protein
MCPGNANASRKIKHPCLLTSMILVGNLKVGEMMWFRLSSCLGNIRLNFFAQVMLMPLGWGAVWVG